MNFSAKPRFFSSSIYNSNCEACRNQGLSEVFDDPILREHAFLLYERLHQLYSDLVVVRDMKTTIGERCVDHFYQYGEEDEYDIEDLREGRSRERLGKSQSQRNRLKRQVEDARNRLLRLDVLELLSAEEMEVLVILFRTFEEACASPRTIIRAEFDNIMNLATHHSITVVNQ
ncbi:hypothetical protein FH972_013471 [Carpinus fangiana]|uniref:Uncharacterized protein n=1 Tax=Carpinus fangiana TaxID=176857 RepID=A0A5N6R740_9ROSI|nr:hypothetical protein FH972_013471 [Carpinus fangiana]